MPTICHLVDQTADWQHETAIAQLLDRLPKDRYAATIATIGPNLPYRLKTLRRPTRALPQVGSFTGLAIPALAKFAGDHQTDILHAWSVSAAFVARADRLRPLIVELFNPAISDKQIKQLITLAHGRHFAVVCTSQTVRRRLIERGIDPALTVIIRPGIDFRVINQIRRSDLRKQWGAGQGDYLVVSLEPATRQNTHDDVLMATILANVSIPGARMIVQSSSPYSQRLKRINDTYMAPSALRCTNGAHSYEQLVACADALIVASDGDLPTTAVAWAMGAGAVVIGPADYALAELVANKLNGLLFKKKKQESPAIAIAKLLRQRNLHPKVVETARGQAFEVFGLRRFVEQHQKLYENLLKGLPPGEGIVDSATR